MKVLSKMVSIIIAFACRLYSVGLGLTGRTEEAQYRSLAWNNFIVAIAINQIRRL